MKSPSLRFLLPSLLLIVFQTNAVAQTSSSAQVGQSIECINGDAAGYPCSNIELLSFLPRAQMAGPDVSEVWGWYDPVDGHEYAIVGHRTGTNFVDVTDPSNPIYLGNLPIPTGSNGNSWRDMKTYQGYLYVVGDNAGPHGVQIFDLNTLRSVVSPPVTFAMTAHYTTDVASAHNIAINEETGFAYVVGDSGACGNGLYMMDLSSPEAPVFVGCHNDGGITGLSSAGYVHDAQCVVYRGPDTDHANKEICFTASESDIAIVDVNDKGNPELLANASYPTSRYVHQGWLTEDHRYFIQGDELDELNGTTTNTRTIIWDVADLDDPILFKEYLASTTAIDHNLYVLGNLVYQANYTSGMRILDISDINDPIEVGFFDTVPGPASAFDGAWGAYPFLPSGNVIVSSGNEGLFVLRPTGTVLANEDGPAASETNIEIFPNPVSQTATIRYTNDSPGDVRVELFDVTGRSVEIIFDGRLPGGESLFKVDAIDLSAGTYVARISRDGATSTLKVTVVR
ncbi:MAG: choice-of-anchor B family protein [Rhodothermales bacterium]|nr:choice-of-anchor B family protein [Rhodothermales bacterium]